MARCAFCEDTLAGKVIRRGGQRFCSVECANEYYMNYSDDLDGEADEEEALSEDLDGFDSFEGDDGDLVDGGIGRYTIDYDEEEDAF